MISGTADTGRTEEKSAPHATSKLLPLAMLLYAISMMKFYIRDPLSSQKGPQGVIEVLLVTGASVALVPALRALRYRLFVPPVAKVFLIFGGLAAISSIFSYDPILSFVKSLSLLLVCGIAVTASSAFGPARVLRSFFYAVILVLAAGLIYKLASARPWFVIDSYSGRARLWLFELTPMPLADLCALTLLTSFVLPNRPSIYLQMLPFAVNIATAVRASSLLLILVLVIWAAAIRSTFRVVLIYSFLGFLATATIWAGLQQPHQSLGLGRIAESLYGNQFDRDLSTFSGRTEVWKVAEPLISESLILGYGIDGFRDVLLKQTSWPAGNAHNSLLELLLTGGLPATLVVLFGWAGSARRAWLSGKRLRLRTLGIYGYMVLFGITAPNVTETQCVGMFLIITIDALLYAQFSPASKPDVALMRVLKSEEVEKDNPEYAKSEAHGKRFDPSL